MKYFILFFISLCSMASAQESQPIRDNSFLIEEAFNQEKGVVQHICLLRMNGSFTPESFSFTQEWPVFSGRHQFSYSLPLVGIESGFTGMYLENIILNYRYQAVGNEKLFFAPRITAILPVHSKGIPTYKSGIEIFLPLSIPLNKFWIMHINAGGNFTSEKSEATGLKSEINTSLSGLSIIYMPSNNFNLLSEFLYSVQKISQENSSSGTSSLTWNPGFRTVINFKSGLQIVPGLSVPVEISEGASKAGFIFYLSFEHPFTKTK